MSVKSALTRRVPRVHRGGVHGATIILRDTYRIEGQFYSRLMYIGNEARPNAQPNKDGNSANQRPENAADAVFVRSPGATPAHYRDFALNPTKLQLKMGEREMQSVTVSKVPGTKEERTDSAPAVSRKGEDGSFESNAGIRLHTGVTYQLVAMLDTSGLKTTVPTERLTCTFRIERISRVPQSEDQKVKVKTVHEINVGPQEKENWVKVDEEEIGATLVSGPDPVLRFTGSEGALVFDTYALAVPYASQYLSDNEVDPLYHTFEHGGATWAVGLNHLCLTACVAMCVRYYAGRDNVDPRHIVQLVEDAAKYYLDHHFNRKEVLKTPHGPVALDANAKISEKSAKSTIEHAADGARSQGAADDAKRRAEKSLKKSRVLALTDGKGTFWPHNLVELLTTPLKEKKFSQEAGELGENLVTGRWPRPTRILGRGAPVIVAQNLVGDWEHARVLRGLVVNHRGEIVRVYGLNPNRADQRELAADGAESNLGWLFVYRPLEQSHIRDGDLLAGIGDVPAPLRDRPVGPAANESPTDDKKSKRP